MKNLTWQNPEQLFVAQELINKVKSKCCGIKAYEKAKIIDASVPELLSLIKYAECVVCVSFHGTALSLVFRKTFISVNGGNIERVSEVLTQLGLTDRIVSDDNLPENDIDYDKVTSQLNILRKKSLSFLLDSLKNDRE